MHRVDGVVLEGRDIRLAAYLVRVATTVLLGRDATLPPGALALRDYLAAEAARQPVAVVTPGNSPPLASPARGTTAPPPAAAAGESCTTAQAAAALGITARAVRGLCRSGDLIAHAGPAGRWVIDAGSVAARAARRRGS